MTDSDLIQIILMGLLVVITGIYAWRTHVISKVTREQADASVKMAEEMKKQTIMSSRPWIIQKAIHEDEKQIRPIEDSFNPNYFSHFEIYNQGGGPAIELEISLLNKEKTPIHSQRKTFLRANETPIEFSPSELASLEKAAFYLVCEYQSIFSHGSQPTWYQTWLPFDTIESSKEGKIYVKSGELEFKEVSEKERIDAFSRRSKPQ